MDEDAWLGSLLETEDPIFAFEGELIEQAWQTVEEEATEAVQPSPWATELSFSFGGGWRDNVLLAESGGVSSGFGQLEADFFALRPRGIEGFEILGLLYSEYRYYDDVPGIDGESLSVGQASFAYWLDEKTRFRVGMDALYSEQAFDAAEFEATPVAATVSVWRPEMSMGFERDMGKFGFLSVGVDTGEARYDLESEDYRYTRNTLAWKQATGERSSLRVEAAFSVEDYDQRLERLSVGALTDESLLRIENASLTGQWDWELGGQVWNRWSTQLLYEQEDDVLGDFYERERWRARQLIDFRLDEWKIELSVAFSQTVYAHRLASSLDDTAREDESWNWGIEATRPGGRSWNWLLRLDGADKRSNASGLSYESNTLYLGCQFLGDGEP